MVMVDILDHQVLHNPIDLSQIDHHARVHVDGTAYSHLELVVVAVVPGTRPEHFAIAGLVPLLLDQDVTGRKGQSSRHGNARWLTHPQMHKSTAPRPITRNPPIITAPPSEG